MFCKEIKLLHYHTTIWEKKNASFKGQYKQE